LHPLFELVISSPIGQFAPLQLRARHLAQSLRHAAYAGIALSLMAAILFGQRDFRELIILHGREQSIEALLKNATGERERIAARISAAGVDPARVRQATKFAALEMDDAPTLESLLQFTARTIRDFPQVRIKTLTYRFPKHEERYCQGRTVIDVPLLDRTVDLPLNRGGTPAVSDAQRFTELQFSILLTDNLAPAAQIEIKKHISALLKAREGVQLMQDPVAFSLINTLKGGSGMDVAQTENTWCMSIPWKLTPPRELP
jgi:hypothetical protein